MCKDGIHFFRKSDYSCTSSMGRVDIHFCNNCLAVKVVQRLDVEDDKRQDNPREVSTIVDPYKQ